VASLFDAQMFFEYYTFDLYERKGNLFNVLPLQPMMGEPSLYQKINFDEFYKMVKKAGGYVCLAHPSCSFSFSEEGKLTNADFQKIDMSCLSSQEVKEIIVELSASGGVRINHSKVKNNIMLKLELLNEKLKQNDIKLDGIEVNVSILRQPLLRRSVLHFVAKNDMDISYGTDTHLSILHESFAKFHTGQISGPEYGALKDYARMLGDKTLPESYKRGYLKQTTKTVKLCKLDSAKDDNELQYTYLVNNVSLLNKIFNTKNNDVLLEHTTHLEHSPNFSNNYDAMQDESANVVLHHKHICTKQDALEYQYHNTPRIQYSKTQSHLLGINAQPSKKSVKNSKSKKQKEIEKQKEKEKIEKRKKHSLKEKLKKEKRKENKKNKHKGSNHKDELSM
jgi:hypothetical protein